MSEADFRSAAGVGAIPPSGSDKEIEHDDPYELVGVRFPVPEGVEADRAAARCIVEDYALMGYSPEQVRRLFDNEVYTGTHDIAQRRGADFVEELIAVVFGPSEGDN